MIDSTTAVHNINNMGTIKSQICNGIVKDIWNWAMKQGIWLSAAHIPGKQNIIADAESRRNVTSQEWMLNRKTGFLLERFFITPPGFASSVAFGKLYSRSRCRLYSVQVFPHVYRGGTEDWSLQPNGSDLCTLSSSTRSELQHRFPESRLVFDNFLLQKGRKNIERT